MFFCIVLMASQSKAQSKPTPSPQLMGFKELLSRIDATFTFPEGVKEIMPPNNEKLPFQYGLKMPDADCEIWLQVNSVKADWQRYEKENSEAGKQLINPDSLYAKMAAEQAAILAGDNNFIIRNMPPYTLDVYHADEGRSYLLTLVDLAATKHYQYALLIVLNKNHYGNIIAACFTNDKGPAFFKNLNKLKSCLKFND